MLRLRDFEECVAESLKGAGAFSAAKTGEPAELHVTVTVAGVGEAKIDLDFRAYPTEPERWKSLFEVTKTAGKKLFDAALGAEKKAVDEEERAKVARCPTCSAWFPSFEARNAHRDAKHRAKASEQPAAEKTVILKPDFSPRIEGGGLQEF